jgi:enediyne biosynthesis protein E4
LLLFQNLGHGRFHESGQALGFRRLPVHSARGAAYCDYDNDGDLDIAVSNIDERPQLLRNDGGNRKHWLELRLVGTRSNRDAIGALVKVRAGDLVQWNRVRTGGSYISGNDLRLHFGLGDFEVADAVEIRWPSGAVEKLERVGLNRMLTVEEGKGIIPSKALSKQSLKETKSSTR